MSDQLLGVFKICLLALLYLFFARVLWAVWSEVRPQQHAPLGDPTATAPAPNRSGPPRPPKGRGARPGRLTVIEPRTRRGATFALDREMSVGRAETCTLSITDDTFVSTLHARIFPQDADVFIEDLNSTNGSYLNGQRITRVNRLSRGDRLQFGNTVLEAE